MGNGHRKGWKKEQNKAVDRRSKREEERQDSGGGAQDTDQASHPIRNKSMWNFIVSWPVVAIVGPAIILLGFGVLSMSPPQIKFAQACFAVGYLIILAKLAWWAAFERTEPEWERALFIGLLFAATGILWFGSNVFAIRTKKTEMGEAKPPCSISVVTKSEIVARVHLRAMILPSGSTEVYKPIFQDLFHDWVINVTPTGTASQVIISIQDVRKPVDNIRVEPPDDAIISEPKPKWFSGFEEPSQTPEFYVRTVSFETLDKPITITIRRPIKSRVGVNTITSLDLDLDRQVRASAEKCKVVLTPLSTVNSPLSGTNPHFQSLIDQLKAILAQKVSGVGFTTRLDPDEPYPPLAVNESEMIQELRCKSSPCTTLSVTMAVNPQRVVKIQ